MFDFFCGALALFFGWITISAPSHFYKRMDSSAEAHWVNIILTSCFWVTLLVWVKV